MARLLGKDYEWVQMRIQKKYLERGEPRLDDDHKVKIHYPPEVFEALRRELQEVESYEVAGANDLAISALAKRLGHDQKWVVARLPYTTIAPVTKINPINNQPLPYYSDDSEAILRNLPEDILKSKKPNR
jgi:hypothetical protein